MICPNCNSENPEGSKFCGKCGFSLMAASAAQESQMNSAQSAPNVQQPIQNNILQQGKKKSFKSIDKRILIGGIVGIIVLILAIVLIVTRKKTLNLEDYTKVSFKGYDTFGTAEVNFDYEKLYQDIEKYGKHLNDKKNSQKNYSDMSFEEALDSLSDELLSDEKVAYAYILKDFRYDLNKDSELSNGDKVSVTFKFDNKSAGKYGLKFEGDKLEFQVKGLEKIREVDPFEDISVEFSGTSPDVSASVVNNSSDEAVKNQYFSVEPSYDIKKGDKVTVTLDISEEDLLRNYGCKFKSYSKEFVCEEVDAYISEGSDLGEEVLSQMKEQTEDTIEAYFAENANDITVSKVKYVGHYFLATKDESSWNSKNIVWMVYSGTVKSKDKSFKSKTVYFPVKFTDIIKYKDGTDYVNFGDTYIEGNTSLEYGWWNHVRGYDKLSLLKNDLVSANKGNYTDEAFGDVD